MLNSRNVVRRRFLGISLGFHFLQKGFTVDFEETEYTLSINKFNKTRYYE